ncbi:MAG: hypothetical protein N3G80_02785, partial [Candidatus Micrarchaeota archaeon]|nr:hypothetical protein [Candidatus Micrarchaeota archaeon]
MQSLGNRKGDHTSGPVPQKKAPESQQKSQFFESAKISEALEIQNSTKMGIREKIERLNQLYNSASEQDKKKIEEILCGQIKFLSEKSTLNASEKIEIIANLNIDPQKDKKVFEAAALAFHQQAKYLEAKERNIASGMFYAGMEIWYPIGEPILGFIQETVKLSEDDARWYKKYLKNGEERELDPAKIADEIAVFARDYYEFQILTADRLYNEEKKRNPPNGIILELLGNIKENAESFMKKLPDGKKKLSAEEKLEIVKDLIKFRVDHLEPALGKIEEEKYWDQLYWDNRDSNFRKALVWLKRHAGTIKLWTAFGISCLNPVAGAVAFSILGGEEIVKGIETGDYRRSLFGLAMIGGIIPRNLMIRTLSTSYLTAEIVNTTKEQIRVAFNTAFTPTDIEHLSNNAILLAGFYKSKLERGAE